MSTPFAGHLQNSTLLPPTSGGPLKVWDQGNCERSSPQVLLGPQPQLLCLEAKDSWEAQGTGQVSVNPCPRRPHWGISMPVSIFWEKGPSFQQNPEGAREFPQS